MTYFKTAVEQMFLAVSEDGYHWRELGGGQPVLKGTVGTKTLRDPFVFRAQDHRYHLFATNGWENTSLVHAISDDLLQWNEQRLVPVMATVAHTCNVWAPECFFDRERGLYRLIWSSTVANWDGRKKYDHRIWTASSRDLEKFSPPRVFLDPGHSVIDATVLADARGYLLAVKDERGRNSLAPRYKGIRLARARRATGPWRPLSDIVSPRPVEGPVLYPLEGGVMLVYDHFMEERYGASFTRDGEHWEDVSGRCAFPVGARHGAVMPIEPTVFHQLVKNLA